MSHFAAPHAYRMFNTVRVLGAAFNYLINITVVFIKWEMPTDTYYFYLEM